MQTSIRFVVKKLKPNHKKLLTRVVGLIFLIFSFLVLVFSLALGGFLMIVGLLVTAVLLMYGVLLIVTGERSEKIEAYIDPFSHL